MEIDGRLAKGWVWLSPFKNGDEVDVIGTQRDDYFEIVAIARPIDRIIALYPHCSRGKIAHIKKILRWWLGSTIIYMGLILPAILAIFDAISGSKDEPLFLAPMYAYVCLTMLFLSGLFSYVNGKKFMIFVRAATKVFNILEFENTDELDLSRKTKRKKGDPGALGVMYFHY